MSDWRFLPLTRRLIEARLDDADAAVDLPDGTTIRLGADWPGDPLAYFPDLAAALTNDDEPIEGSLVAVRASDGRAVALAGTKGRPDDKGDVEIGYGVIPELWGHGVATATVEALLADLWTWPEVRAVIAETALTNVASQRVLARHGFTVTGERRDAGDGDVICWRLERPDP